jgi:hypothetical protein
MKLSTAAAGLLAGAALLCPAPAARAEFTLEVKTVGKGGGFRIQGNADDTAFTLTTIGGVKADAVKWTADDGVITATAVIAGYTFDVVGRSNRGGDPALGVVSFSGTVKTNSGANTANFAYAVSDGPFTSPGAAPDNLYLTTSLFSPDGGYTSGNLVRARSAYATFGTGVPVKTYQTGNADPLHEAGMSSVSNTVEFDPDGALYGRTELSGFIGMHRGGMVSFWAQAVTAMPEPTGLVVALVGLPCMALVVRAARRRAARAAAAA